MTAIKHGVTHTLGVVGAGLTAGSRVCLVGLADEGQTVEVVSPEILLRDTGNGFFFSNNQKTKTRFLIYRFPDKIFHTCNIDNILNSNAVTSSQIFYIQENNIVNVRTITQIWDIKLHSLACSWRNLCLKWGWGSRSV